jgi:hypothetical protein
MNPTLSQEKSSPYSTSEVLDQIVRTLINLIYS